jgi:hypothetical protein
MNLCVFDRTISAEHSLFSPTSLQKGLRPQRDLLQILIVLHIVVHKFSYQLCPSFPKFLTPYIVLLYSSDVLFPEARNPDQLVKEEHQAGKLKDGFFNTP